MYQQRDVDAHRHLVSNYPELKSIFDRTGITAMPTPKFESIEEAVISTIAGQMLSRQAASTIYRRIDHLARSKNLQSMTDLSDDDLRNSGLSYRKIRTVRSFRLYMDEQPETFWRWKDMSYQELTDSIKGEIWGFSDWSISMIGLFHFNHIDIFPTTDGTIKRAVAQLRDNLDLPRSLDPSKASPYSSYLALFLWRAVDENII
jgi:DNA-3-methyladenine glycosylase II